MIAEDQYWQAVRSGNSEALAEMYKAYYQFLFVNGYRQSANKELTKDVIHEMFLELWNNRKQLPPVQHVGFYLKTWMRRKMLKEIPDKMPTDIGTEAELNNIQFSYEELLVQLQTRQEVQEKVRRAVQSLSRREMEIIRMKFFEEKSYQEIAAITSTTPRTIYNQVYRSLQVLRKHLKTIAGFF